MRLHHVGVLVAVALLACVDVVSATASSKIMARSLAENRNEVLSTRLLRTHDLQDGEERLFGLEKVSQALSSAKSKMKINQNIRTWVKEGQSADDAFKLLQLDDRVDHVLSSKNIKFWSKFISMYNAKNPRNQVSMIDLLTKRFGEAEVSKMLVSAKTVKGTEEWATKLQAAQVAGWINKGKSPLKVFRILELGDQRNNPLVNRNFDAFANYLGVFNNRNPEKERTLLQVFTEVYGGEKNLVTWLQTAKRLPDAPAKGDVLETALFMKWFKAKWSMNKVLKNLGIKSSEMDLYASFMLRYDVFRVKELTKVHNAVQ